MTSLLLLLLLLVEVVVTFDELMMNMMSMLMNCDDVMSKEVMYDDECADLCTKL